MINNIDDKNIGNLTIWVGAGISIKEPSNLPSGNQLTEFVLTNMILGKDKFMDIWDKINLFENKYCNLSTTKFPRLELLLSSIAYIEKFFMGKGTLKGSFLKGLNAFDEVPFNDNHMLLATLVHAGARVMTANFDLGIERAYKKLFGEECHNIVHFHGTNSSGDKIGATIENITHFVNSTIENKVKKSFDFTRSNYFFGYSFSDRYDINAAINEIYSNVEANCTKQNIVCNHNGIDQEQKEKVVDTFSGKENVQVFTGETTEALKRLCQMYSVNIPFRLGESEYVSNNRSWKELFIEKTEITEEFKVLSTIHFFNRLGIAVDKVDIEILKKYENMKINNNKKEILEYHLAANSKYWFERYGNTRLKTEYHKKELYKRQSKSKLKNVLYNVPCTKSVEDVVRDIEKKKFISYDDFIELNSRMTKIELQLIKKEKNVDISEVEYLIERFSDYPVGKYISIKLYASIFRYRLLLSGVKKVDNQNDYKKANEIYYDIGNIDGIVSTKLCYFIYCRNSGDLDGWKLKSQTQEWKDLRELCIVTGSYRCDQLMEMLEKI